MYHPRRPMATEAQATNEADRQQILEDIRKTIGLEKLNNLIRTALVDSTRLEVGRRGDLGTGSTGCLTCAPFSTELPVLHMRASTAFPS